jgi:small nuclear ribonucleoprotein (snRNP)-like protein
MPNGDKTTAPMDHIRSLNKISKDPKMFLGLGQVKNGKADIGKIHEVANNPDNLVLTNASLNGSKGEHDLKDWMKKEKIIDGKVKTNAERFSIDPETANELYERANNSIDAVANKALLRKQTAELLHTGGMQALQMSGRQALGLLLTELVNGLFNEFKLLIQHGVEVGKTLIQEITERLKKVAISVAKKIPDALSQGLQGGVSGFVSNLLTFLINTFLSTAKRFVTVIREGLLGLYRAFKMIFFPPAHMTSDQALQEGIKILTVVITTATGILLQEAVKTFVSSMPFLLPIAEALSAVIIGIITGLLSAFLAYQIDCLFDRLRNSHDERMMDQMMTDARGRDEFASSLITLTESSLDNVWLYSQSACLNEEISGILQHSSQSADQTLNILLRSVEENQTQISKSREAIMELEESHEFIAGFLEGEKS